MMNADWTWQARGVSVRVNLSRTQSDADAVAVMVHETVHAKEYMATAPQQRALFRSVGLTGPQWGSADWSYHQQPSEKAARAAAVCLAHYNDLRPHYSCATLSRILGALG